MPPFFASSSSKEEEEFIRNLSNPVLCTCIFDHNALRDDSALHTSTMLQRRHLNIAFSAHGTGMLPLACQPPGP